MFGLGTIVVVVSGFLWHYQLGVFCQLVTREAQIVGLEPQIATKSFKKSLKGTIRAKDIVIPPGNYNRHCQAHVVFS